MKDYSLVVLERLRSDLPPVFTRKTICKYLGGILAPGTLANLDSRGEGPQYIKLGKTVMYERETFLDWLAKRMISEQSND